MLSTWSAYWKILFLSAEPFEAVMCTKDGLWLSLRLFLLVALLASLAGLSGIPDAIDQPTLAERIDSLARRIEESIPMVPTILGRLLEEFVSGIDQVAAQIRTFEPPLGVRPSRITRLIGAWLERPLDLLTSWFGMALATWIVARFMGGDGSPREHISLAILAVAPLAFYVIFDLLSNGFASGATLAYVGWAFRLGLWVWSAVILIRAIALAHRIPPDRAVAILIISALIFLLLIPALQLGLIALFLVLLF